MQRVDGLMSHAVIDAGPEGAVLVWFVNDRPLGYRTFSDWASALSWSDQLQAQNWSAGWRLTTE